VSKYTHCSLVKSEIDIQDNMQRVVDLVTINAAGSRDLYATYHPERDIVSIHSLLDWGSIRISVEQAKKLIGELNDIVQIIKLREKVESPISG